MLAKKVAKRVGVVVQLGAIVVAAIFASAGTAAAVALVVVGLNFEDLGNS